MAQETVGAFLKDKLGNMARWATGELKNTDYGVDLEHFVRERTEMECAYLAGLLSTNSNMITHRDWSGLARIGEMPRQLLDVFHLIRQREDMHDKFWRYLELFANVISND